MEDTSKNQRKQQQQKRWNAKPGNCFCIQGSPVSFAWSSSRTCSSRETPKCAARRSALWPMVSPEENSAMAGSCSKKRTTNAVEIKFQVPGSDFGCLLAGLASSVLAYLATDIGERRMIHKSVSGWVDRTSGARSFIRSLDRRPR